MTGSFVLDYILLTFLLSCGVFQTAAACGGFRGLQFFTGRVFSIIFGLTVFTLAFAWFFLSESRNVPDTGLGLNGNEQFGYFFAGAGMGLAFTLAVSSLLHRNLGKSLGRLPRGLDALKLAGYHRCLTQAVREFRAQTKDWSPAGIIAWATFFWSRRSDDR
ncbi:MAG: hypothetical protein BZY87_00280 [SAR202 cluster bacterium Io17-Chloro-G6]|nr:MAG: hypothetical protein BZY87_00280 [SAR202 cluster bacterium Io17-Chloro-G6]